MKIRRFRWNQKDHPGGWEPHHLYIEYHDGLPQFLETATGPDKSVRSFTPADAERLVAEGAWVELGSLLHMPAIGDWPEDFSHENGNYWCICSLCHANFTGHKRRLVCKACHRAGLALEVDLPLARLVPATAVIAPIFTELRVNGELITPRTLDSAELYQHFRNFRYATICVNGFGSVYTDALKFIDDEVRIRVAEILKGMQ